MATSSVAASLAAQQPSSPVSIQAASTALGVSAETLRRHDRAGRFDSAVYRTAGNHRRFDLSRLRQLLGIVADEQQGKQGVQSNGTQVIALVSRASSAKQADTSIPEQKRALEEYVSTHFPSLPFKHFTRTASGLNFDAIMPLVEEVIEGRICRVIACNYDRLLRLGNKLLTHVFNLYNCEVVFINDGESTDSLELDLLALVQWYCNSYSGKRFAAKYGCKPTAEQLSLIHSCFTQHLGLKKTLAHLEEENQLLDATGKPITISFLHRYRRKHRRLFTKLVVKSDGDSSLALPTDDRDSFTAFCKLLDREAGKMRFKEVWGRYRAFVQERGQVPMAQNSFSTRLRAAGFRTTYYNGYLYLRAAWA